MNISRLKKKLAGNHDFKGHTILGSMCTEPHPVAIKTYKRFLSTNVGDPGLFPKLIELEKEYIRSIGKLLGNNDAYGSVISGGSEANILALWTARNRVASDKREVIISETCHFSFDKAADILGLKLVKIPIGNDYKINIELAKKSVSEKTMAIVGIAGTTGLGVCDSITELSEIAIKNNIYLHVDAAFGGFVFPFIENGPAFDFSLPGVMSITIDPHKMGRAVIQSGCIIYRNKEISESIKVPVTYLSGGRAINRTILGTRSGASIASSWMIYNYLGFNGYKKIVERSMGLTKWFVSEIKEIKGLDVKVDPECNVVGITSVGDYDIKILLQKLREYGWAVSEWSDYIRITIMPHVKKRTLIKFLNNIRSIL